MCPRILLSGKGTALVSRALEREGIRLDQKRTNISEVHDSSLFLFKRILDPHDPRVKLAIKHAELKKKYNFKPINLENGLRAVYASRRKGYRGRWTDSPLSVQQLTQLSRALTNIRLSHKLIKGRKPLNIKGDYSLNFELTNSIMVGKDKRGVTGCPEAMCQLHLTKSGKYLGRIGFNFHIEKVEIVISVANVQGAEGKKNELDEFKEQFRENFGEFLIKKLMGTMGPKFIYRGIRPNGNNMPLYTMSFRKSGITTFKK
jgi:hypothetical protein